MNNENKYYVSPITGQKIPVEELPAGTIPVKAEPSAEGAGCTAGEWEPGQNLGFL